ncbi:MAG: DUF1971 domain-containing protein [Gammaproteobacteria bacterium]
MRTLPPHVQPYKRTPDFTCDTVPTALLHAHDTKPGVWGRIVVVEGEVLYRILEPTREEVLLSPALDGVVEPTVKHAVEPRPGARFHVEFLRAPD